jgi:hypothetical protein
LFEPKGSSEPARNIRKEKRALVCNACCMIASFLTDFYSERLKVKRSTPYFDRWVNAVEHKLARRGAKAELARYLSKQYGRPARSWESNLAQIIARNLLPNAEIFLAIDRWIARQEESKPKRAR